MQDSEPGTPGHIARLRNALRGPRVVQLSGRKAAGRVAPVSDEDYDLVMAYRWNVDEQRYPNGMIRGPYARTSIWLSGGRQRWTGMHNLITGRKNIDHRDGNGLNNQRANLREATDAENNRNRGPTAVRPVTSAFKGVYRDRSRRTWRAEIMADGVKYRLGRFAVEAAAAHAYDAKAAELHGGFAWLNFPREEAG